MCGEGEVVTKLTNAVNEQNIHKFSHKNKIDNMAHENIKFLFFFFGGGEYNIKEKGLVN